MKSKDFIINELDLFVRKFSQVRVRYEFRESSNAHFIEVSPSSVYNLDEGYITWELEMYDKFIDLYPYEGICFITNDALVGIENPVYIKEGLDFAIGLIA